jgi:hypothetical protein
MATSSILGGERAASRADGRDVDSLGPSDSSDSGSDIQGERRMSTGADNDGELGATPARRDTSTDALGTGERAAAGSDDTEDGADIAPDRVEGGRRGDLDADVERLAGAEDVELPTDLDGDGEADELAPP